MVANMSLVKLLTELKEPKISEVGGKGYSLAVLINNGLNVPKGFVIISGIFFEYLRRNNLMEKEKPDMERIKSSWVFKEINRCIKKDNFSGIKLHPVVEAFAPDNPIFEPIFELATDLDVPVQIHCDRVCNFTGNPQRIFELANKFPKLKICAIHLYAEDTIKILSQEKKKIKNKKIKNIYIDISEVAKGRLIKKAIKEFGDDRVVFGSDYPYGDPNIILAIFRELKLDEEKSDKILSKNALRLLGK